MPTLRSQCAPTPLIFYRHPILLVVFTLASPDHELVTIALHCSRKGSAAQAWRLAEMNDVYYFLVDQQGGQCRP